MWANEVPSCVGGFGERWDKDDDVCYLCGAESECEELTKEEEQD